MLDPEALPVAPNADVVSGNDAAAQLVLDGGEGGEKTVSFGGGDEPHANLAVLVSGEDPRTAERDGLDEARTRALVEGVNAGVMGEIEDVDEVDGCGVEKVTVDCEAGDMGC